jgi:hypothetical protein
MQGMQIMDEPNREAIEAEAAGASPVREGEAFSNPAHGNRVQAFRDEPGGPEGISLDLLCRLDEPTLLIRSLKDIARQRPGREWSIILSAAEIAANELDLLQKPKSA